MYQHHHSKDPYWMVMITELAEQKKHSYADIAAQINTPLALVKLLATDGNQIPSPNVYINLLYFYYQEFYNSKKSSDPDIQKCLKILRKLVDKQEENL